MNTITITLDIARKLYKWTGFLGLSNFWARNALTESVDASLLTGTQDVEFSGDDLRSILDRLTSVMPKPVVVFSDPQPAAFTTPKPAASASDLDQQAWQQAKNQADRELNDWQTKKDRNDYDIAKAASDKAEIIAVETSLGLIVAVQTQIDTAKKAFT